MRAGHGHYLRGRRGLWAACFAFVSLFLVAGGIFFYRAEAEHIEAEKYGELKAIAELKAAQIAHWREERLADAGRNREDPFLRADVEAFSGGRDSPKLRESLRERLKAELRQGTYRDVVLIAPDGRCLLATSDQSYPVNDAEIRALRECAGTGQAALSEFYRAPDGRVYIDAVGPIIGTDGTVIAMVALRSDPETYLYPLVQSWPGVSGTAETLLVRRDGENVLFLNELRHRHGTALTLTYGLTERDVAAVQAVLGKEGVYRGRDYRGMEVLADLRSVPGSKWHMVAKVDAREILAEARYRAGAVSVVVLLALLLAGLGTAYAYRHRQAGLYKSLYHAEQSEREAQELFRTTLYSIGDAVITTDSRGRVMHMNLVGEKLTGWKETEARGRSLHDVFHIISEVTRAEAESPVDRVLKEGEIVGLANHTVLIGRDGVEYPIADSGAPIRSGKGDVIGVVLVFRDQTREREAERALRESEEKYREFFTTSQDCVFITSPYGDWIDFNDAALDIFGFGTREEFSSFPVSRLYEHPEERARFHRLIAEEGFVRDHPLRLKRKDGAVVDVLVTAAGVKSAEGSLKAIIGTLRDVTERKRIEDALRESEERYRRLFDDAVLGVFQSTPEGRIVTVNRAYARMFGYSSPEDLMAAVTDVATDLYADPDQRREMVRAIEEAGGSLQVENLYKRKDGSTFVGKLYVWSAPAAKGAISLEGFVEDITPRRLAEQALKEGEGTLRALIDATHESLVLIDLDGIVLVANEVVARRLGGTVREITGTSLYRHFPPDLAKSRRARYEEAIRTASSVHFVDTRAGRHYDTYVYPVFSGEGVVARLAIFAHDITERKEGEEKLRTSLREKEVLLKEIHHRVKNNLQIVSSLLNMQSHHVNDPADAGALRTSMDRIKSMALIHDKLYRSENVAGIFFPDYARDLLGSLSRTYGLGKRINMIIDLAPVSLDIDTAIPLGLIINELISNSLKHGFPDQREGSISIGLQRDGDGLLLVIADDGVGFPEGMDFAETETLGMQLVVSLVEQLEGTIDLVRGEGARFRIRLKSSA